MPRARNRPLREQALRTKEQRELAASVMNVAHIVVREVVKARDYRRWEDDLLSLALEEAVRSAEHYDATKCTVKFSTFAATNMRRRLYQFCRERSATLQWKREVMDSDCRRKGGEEEGESVLMQTAVTFDPPCNCDERDALKRALASLPADRRKVITDRIYDGKTFAESAEELGVDKRAYWYRYESALRVLRRAFNREIQRGK